MALYTKEGLRFNDKEEAINWFVTTLDETSPLGELYERLHNVDWGKLGYEIQATGINDKEVHIQLDNPNHKGKLYRRVQLNTYQNTDVLVFEQIDMLLKNMVKSVDIAAIIAYDELNRIRAEIEKEHEDYIDDKISDFSKLTLTVQAERNMIDGSVLIAITDEVTNKQYHTSIQTDEEGRVDVEQIEIDLRSMFLNTLSGEFDGDEVKVGDSKLQYLLDFAHENSKSIKVELID
ncbi:hypothetical protein QOK74_07910 [Staphylococcus saprophyticus]|uniref:hypothetical protein n=1 Tax=Staphylococcus saprophyticus TaxID=29385 RepID=UPI0024C349DD|nr:hypothetical protein [Staphylococcus saprophyticus]MDK1672794.1 hypothetical protein [Staphylococcus saprophyticus]